MLLSIIFIWLVSRFSCSHSVDVRIGHYGMVSRCCFTCMAQLQQTSSTRVLVAETFIQESQYQTIAHAHSSDCPAVEHHPYAYTVSMRSSQLQATLHHSRGMKGRYITRGVPSWVCGYSFCQHLLGVLALGSASFASALGHASGSS